MKKCGSCGLENRDEVSRCCECGGTSFNVPAFPAARPETVGSALWRHSLAIGSASVFLFGLAEILTNPAVNTGDSSRPVSPSAIRCYLLTTFALSLSLSGLAMFPIARRLERAQKMNRDRVGGVLVLGVILVPGACLAIGMFAEDFLFLLLAGAIVVLGLASVVYLTGLWADRCSFQRHRRRTPG